MTPEQRAAIFGLVRYPPRGERRVSPEQVLQQFGTDDGQGLGLDLLRDAARRQDTQELQAAMIVCFVFGFAAGHLDLLIQLAGEDWHISHEEVVSGLDELRSPQAIGALVHAAWWVPQYLGWDENRALARKATYALGNIPGAEAEQALIDLLDSDSEAVREDARYLLARRAGR